MTSSVQLAVSPLGGMPGVSAYHTSVLLGGAEYFFSDQGIGSGRGTASHVGSPGRESAVRIIDMGTTAKSGGELMEVLERHFQPGTYDLLRKNCNSFSDCALFLLVRRRLDPTYRALERLGAGQAGLLQAFSGGRYMPNTRAATFDLDQVIAELSGSQPSGGYQSGFEGSGQALGGAGGAGAASCADGLRQARLARFDESAASSFVGSALAGLAAAASSVTGAFVGQQGAATQPPADTAADESLARRLQAEEEEAESRLRADEELARRLAAAEETPSAPRRRSDSGSRQQAAGGGPPFEGNPLTAVLGGLAGLSMGMASAAANAAGRGGGAGGSPSVEAPEGSQGRVAAGRDAAGLEAEAMLQALSSLADEVGRNFDQAANGLNRDAGIAGRGLHERLAPILAQLDRTIQSQTGGGRGQVDSSSLERHTIKTVFRASQAAGGGGAGNAEPNCAVCLEAFQDGEELRVLPCFHRYHPGCIDPYLLQHDTLCPVCKHPVLSG
eukprot:TRINITY_DN111487_c0_g1_i1.p1 TRINITY_DN111487_c0_g1~~TRINITY_DN111487_c0_g1_i1.p1  ORF type:complete len:532 (+),score=93.35 TRINITY_DN111487_c0_g1_i1:97-1596(+)